MDHEFLDDFGKISMHINWEIRQLIIVGIGFVILYMFGRLSKNGLRRWDSNLTNVAKVDPPRFLI